MKIISFDPEKEKKIPEFFNKNIDENSGKEKYLMFIFNDIYESIKNVDELVKKYTEFMDRYNLPYVFYPYYVHFNKIFPDSIGYPNPRAHVLVSKNNDQLDIISNPAYGLIIINIEKMNEINFRFNTKYSRAFYIQNLINECFKHKLWISSHYFIDVKNSYTLFELKNNGYVIPSNEFLKEKEEFRQETEMKPESINDFINSLKTYLNETKETI